MGKMKPIVFGALQGSFEVNIFIKEAPSISTMSGLLYLIIKRSLPILVEMGRLNYLRLIKLVKG